MRDMLLVNARLVTMRGARYSIIDRGALRVREGRIAWVGPMGPLWEDEGVPVVDAEGALVTPGLIDCHTHLVHAGNRALEFEQRLQGRTYEDIARAGGGIAQTVRATRAASEETLRAESLRRLEALASEGVTTVEIKSGYGLELESELKMLRVARSLAGERMHVVTTLLAAHAVPPEFRGRADDYVEHICEEILPAAVNAKLADAVDAFCEGIAFSPEQTRRIFTRACDLGLRVKLHADQLSDRGGAHLAAEFRALSADHLEHTGDAGVRALARAGTVAVLLPGAFYFLRETRAPPVEALRREGVPIAVATDCNPGTAPIASPVAVLNMACTLFRLTPEEAFAGMTSHAARALGLEADRGTLEEGKRADFALWDVGHPSEIAAQIGIVKPRAVYVDGESRGP